MNIVSQYGIRGADASSLADSVETAVREGRLPPGERLPTVREVARRLRLSPTTVAAAYAILRRRGLVQGRGRDGTRVTPRPPLTSPVVAPVPDDLRNLADGNPDPRLLPVLAPVLARLTRHHHLYGQATNRPDLLELARAQLAADGVPAAPVAVVGGALDGIERILQAHLRPGDRVAVEDPGFFAVFDLLTALALIPEPVGLDDSGPQPAALACALESGAKALVLTPRAQNPTGAVIDQSRARELRAVLERFPETLIVEDDHAGSVAGAPVTTLAAGRERWAVVRSVSKSLGPDLRLAVLTGDPVTVSRVEGRQIVGAGWVSHILQETVARLWAAPATARLLERAAGTYRARREALIEALAREGIPAQGRSGLNVWIPVPEEAAVVAALAAAGWAVRAGERYRLKGPPAIRVTVATLEPREAGRLARAFGTALGRARRGA